MQLPEVSDIDLSVFEPVPDHQAGRLSVPDLQGDQSLRVRGKNVSEDLFSEFSSVSSSRGQNKSTLDTTNTLPPPSPLPRSILLDDLDLSSESSEDEVRPEVVRVQNVTTGSLLEGQRNASQMNDVSSLEEKMKKRKVTKNLKAVPYLPPSEGVEEEEEEDEEEEEMEDAEVQEAENKRWRKQEVEIKMCKKAGLNRGMMKTVFESYSNFRTPVNFQLVDKKRGSNDQWIVTLSDGLWKHEFVMSGKFDYVMTKIRDNSILCVNQIYHLKEKKSVPKKKVRTLLITNFFVPTMQQVGYNLIGLPKTLKL